MKELTPKETAVDIFNKYIQASVVNEDGETHVHYKPYSLAKQCALIAVDEIISVCNLMGGGFSFEHEIEFWQSVKTEIEKL